MKAPKLLSCFETCRKYPGVERAKTEQDLLLVLPDLRALVTFYHETKRQTFPGYYGQSPYDYAFHVASLALGGKVTSSFVLASDSYAVAMRYRERAGLNTARGGDFILLPSFMQVES